MAYRRILVPFDPSGCAADVFVHVAKMAEKFSSKVVFVNVIEAPSGVLGGGEYTVRDAFLAEVRSFFNFQLHRFQFGFEPELVVREGAIVPTIRSCIEEYKPDLVIMGTHGRKGIRRIVMGSVAEAVMRECTVPVMIIHAAEGTLDEPSEAWRQLDAESQG